MRHAHESLSGIAHHMSVVFDRRRFLTAPFYFRSCWFQTGFHQLKTVELAIDGFAEANFPTFNAIATLCIAQRMSLFSNAFVGQGRPKLPF